MILKHFRKHENRLSICVMNMLKLFLINFNQPRKMMSFGLGYMSQKIKFYTNVSKIINTTCTSKSKFSI